MESSEAEITLHTEVRGFRLELDEAKRKASRLSQEHWELLLRLENTEKEKETLKQSFIQLEELQQRQERALEKLNKEVRRSDAIVYACKQMKVSAALNKKIHKAKQVILLVFQYESLTVSSRGEVQALRVQLEEQREKARKEMQEFQWHGNDAQSELERSYVDLKRLEEEVCAHAHPLPWLSYSLFMFSVVVTHHIHGACLTDCIKVFLRDRHAQLYIFTS